MINKINVFLIFTKNKKMLIIISPAKKSQIPQIKRKDYTKIEFPEESKILVSELRKFKPEKLSSLMNISPKLAELNYERYINWNFPFETDNTGAALFMFNGDVYRGMQPNDFTEDDVLFTQNRLRILSGLYGIIKPLDKIMPYRLEMGTKLQTENGQNLYQFWGDKITERLNKYLQKSENKVLINLASDEYFKAVKKLNVTGKIITPVFKEQKRENFKVIAIYAKRARGLMCRFIIKNKITKTEDLKVFDYEKYSYNEDLSSEEEFVFTR